MKRKTSIVTTVMGIAIVAIFMYGCKGDQSDQEVVIGFPQLRIGLPVIVAKEKGYFEKYGLKVKLQSYPTAQPMIDALIGNNINVAGYAALPICFSAMARSNKRLIFLTGMYENDQHPISILIVKPNGPIKTIRDLKGKRIGILPTRAYEVWLKTILEENNINPSDVIVQQIAPNLQADALSSGSVDALFTNDPSATVTIQKGYGVSLSPDTALVPQYSKISPFYFGSFCISEQYGHTHPDIVKKISNALDDAIEFINNNQEESKKIINKNYLPEQQIPFVIHFPNSLYKKTNDVPDDDLTTLKNFYLKTKVLPGDIDTKGLQYKRK